MKANRNISNDRIERLEEIGFQWQVLRTEYCKTFEKHCRELIAFKEEFGHCNVLDVMRAISHWEDGVTT